MNITPAICNGVEVWSQAAELLDTSDSVALAKFYVGLKSALDQYQKALKPMEELKSRFAQEILPAAFDRAGVKSLTLEEEGYRVTSTATPSVSFVDSEAGLAWLRANGQEGLIKEGVAPQTLKAFAKDRISNGEDLPEDVFKVFLLSNVSVTKV